VSILILLGFASRLLPHPANFAPIAAIALFSGMYLNHRWAVVAPLLAMFASDLFIGLYDFRIMAAVYISFALSWMIGLWVKKRKKFSTVLGGTLLGSIIFFLTTNAAVWAFAGMYLPSFEGLMQSYYMALPFFRNSLLGDLFYVGVMVGSVEFVTVLGKWFAKKIVKMEV